MSGITHGDRRKDDVKVKAEAKVMVNRPGKTRSHQRPEVAGEALSLGLWKEHGAPLGVDFPPPQL